MPAIAVAGSRRWQEVAGILIACARRCDDDADKKKRERGNSKEGGGMMEFLNTISLDNPNPKQGGNLKCSVFKVLKKLKRMELLNKEPSVSIAIMTHAVWPRKRPSRLQKIRCSDPFNQLPHLRSSEN